jgi:L-fuconolactonase
LSTRDSIVDFVDSHVHFWDTGLLDYPWLSEFPGIAGRHTPEELGNEAGASTPGRIVFVQAECDRKRWLDEVEWVEALAAREPRIAGIVAHAPMDGGPGTLAAIERLAGKPLVRGARHLIQGEPDPLFCIRPEFLAGVRELGRRGLTFDICCRHSQLPAVIELVRRCPQTVFILDHGGKPAIERGGLNPWREHIAALAAEPNLVCKLSGLVTEARRGGWCLDDLRPYAAHLLASFGPGRILFGSDWPVAKLACGYLLWLEGARQLVSDLAPRDIRAVFSDNARRVYRLP